MHFEYIEKKIINRKCIVCNDKSINWSLSYIDMPAMLGVTDGLDSELIDLNVLKCDKCGVVNLAKPQSSSMYNILHSEAIGKIWEDHHINFAHYIQKYINGNQILEIGPSNNPITRKLINFDECEVEYVDLVAPDNLSSNEEMVQCIFPDVEKTEKFDGGFDAIIASHVLEHSDVPVSFIQKAIELLKPNGNLFISIPNFSRWFENNYMNAITREHFWYPLPQHLDKICHTLNCCFDMDCTVEYQQHSLFMKITNKPYKQSVKNVLYPNIDLLKWSFKIHNTIQAIANQIEKPSYIFGASHLSQYPILMNEKIAKNVISCLDNSKSKIGKTLYGTQVKVEHPDVLRSLDSPSVILLPNPYQDEIIEQLLKINKDLEFII